MLFSLSYWTKSDLDISGKGSKLPSLIPRPSTTVWEWDWHYASTFIFLSLMESLKSGRDSRETIQVCPSTWAAVHRCMGSTCSMRRTRSLAEGEIESQFPPERLILPSPIRDKICWGVSSGPVAKGVQLKGRKGHSVSCTAWTPFPHGQGHFWEGNSTILRQYYSRPFTLIEDSLTWRILYFALGAGPPTCCPVEVALPMSHPQPVFTLIE